LAHGVPAARGRLPGARRGGGRRGRWHLVLEPVPGGALRLRVDVLLLLLPARTGAGVAARRALSDPAGDLALSTDRCPAARPAEALRVRGAGRQRPLE